MKEFSVTYKGKDFWSRDVYKVKDKEIYLKKYDGEDVFYVAGSMEGEPEFSIKAKINIEE